ncbi:MAG TPA: CoA ester lyase [Chloroflexota bacterium]|jgi:citrate lyase subunit beta/citryl-CoA lyase|nr:CoA ester lyase [Chloroflexota bacterium]
MLRSMLFVPGDQPRKIEKALTEIPADAVILDLEDAVAISAKEATRAPVAEALSRARRPRVYVRVNGIETPWFFGDLEAVTRAGLDGIVLPKTAGAEDLYLADRYLSHLERQRGLAAESVELLPLIETARGATSIREICTRALARVRRLGLGAADLTADAGLSWTAHEAELLFVRTEMTLWSRRGALQPPIDTVYPHFRDQPGLEATSRRARELGFGGKTCIHPDQIEPVNRIFRPTEEELAWAREVLAAFEASERQGVAALQVRGQLIDYAFAVRARHILAQAGEHA